MSIAPTRPDEHKSHRWILPVLVVLGIVLIGAYLLLRGTAIEPFIY